MASQKENTKVTANEERTSVEFFAGVDPALYSQLPRAQQFPYQISGFITTIIGFAFGVSTGLFFYELLSGSTVIAVILGFIATAFILAALRSVNSFLLHRNNKWLLIACCLAAPLFAAIFSIPIGIRVAEPFLSQQNAASIASDTINQTYKRDSLLQQVKLYRDSAAFLKNTGLTTKNHIDSLNKRIQKDSSDLLKLEKRLGVSQNELSFLKAKVLEVKGNRDVNDKINALEYAISADKNALSIIRDEISKLRKERDYSNSVVGQYASVRDSFARRSTALAARDSLRSDSLAISLQQSRALITDMLVNKDCHCTFEDRLQFLRNNYASNSSIKAVLIASFVLLLLMILSVIGITVATRNDAYHTMVRDIRVAEETARKSVKSKYSSSSMVSDDPQQELLEQIREYEQNILIDSNDLESWKKLTELYGKAKEPAKQKAANDRYVQLFAAKQLEENLSSKISIRTIELDHLSFYGSFTWELKSRINILLGKNGYGKSHLMNIVLAHLQEEEARLREFTNIDKSTGTSPFIKINLHAEPPRNREEIETLRAKIAQLHERRITLLKEASEKGGNGADATSSQIDKEVHELYQKLKSAVNAEQTSKPKEIELLSTKFGELNVQRKTLLKELSENEGVHTDPQSLQINKELNELYKKLEFASGISLFDKLGIHSTYGKIPVLAIPDSRFINKSATSTSMSDEKEINLRQNGAFHFIYELPYESVIQNLLNIIGDIYINQSPPVNENEQPTDEIFSIIVRVYKRLTGQTFTWSAIKRNQLGSGYLINVRAEGSVEDLPIQKISQGTLSVISIVGMIFHYLTLRYNKMDRHEVAKQHAVVFIDEIDAHLHPSWQQKIIGILRMEFPNIQFIISAHSPLVIMGCKEEEVSVLRKIKDRQFTMVTMRQNFIGKPIGDIYKTIFEIEEKDETFMKLEALRPLQKAYQEKAEEIRSKRNPTMDDKQLLEKINKQMEDFVYLDQFSAMQDTFNEKENLKQENEDLKKELEQLKPSSPDEEFSSTKQKFNL